jgi:hypothetical protein
MGYTNLMTVDPLPEGEFLIVGSVYVNSYSRLRRFPITAMIDGLPSI